MSLKSQISEAYHLLEDENEDTEGVHINFVRNEGTSNEEEVGILEFLDSTTVYIERYGEETSDVKDASDMDETEFVEFVMNVLSL